MARVSFLPNTDNFLVLFIVFKWGRIFQNAGDRQELKCNLQSRPNYFFVSAYVLYIVI